MFTRQSPAFLAEQIAQRSAQSPEFWLFNAPASSKEIKRLETRLGRALPEPLAHSLSKSNGGFASPEGKIGIDSLCEIGVSRDRANRFLSCDEISGAYRALLSAHPSGLACEFPFIPFMRQAEGGLLTINAEDPLSAVWHAWTPDGPHLWRRLYPSFGDLLAHYLDQQGAIRDEPYDDEPTATPAH